MMTRIRQMSQEKGFTLIELLIVIVILGILAAVGIPKFMANKRDAWTKTCKANRASLDDAVERYHFDVGTYPTSQDDLTSAGSVSTSLWKGPYIKRAFECPADNSTAAYNFASASTGVTCANMSGTSALHD